MEKRHTHCFSMQTIGFSRAEAEVYMHKLEVLVVVKFKVFMDQVVMK